MRGKRKGINLCRLCRTKPARAKGMCTTCYQRQRRAELRAGLAVCAFTGGQEPEKAKLHTNLPDLDAIASNPESYLVQDMGEGRTMEIFKTPGEEVWFRYTFPLRKENNPFGKKEEKVCERWLTSVPKVG